MTHAGSKYWLTQTVYLKHDDQPGIVSEVRFIGDPTHPSTEYKLGWTNGQFSVHPEGQLSASADKNFK